MSHKTGVTEFLHYIHRYSILSKLSVTMYICMSLHYKAQCYNVYTFFVCMSLHYIDTVSYQSSVLYVCLFTTLIQYLISVLQCMSRRMLYLLLLC